MLQDATKTLNLSVVSCQWSVVISHWSVVSGQWSVVISHWSLANIFLPPVPVFPVPCSL
ncbi:MAG: hypothetical protein HCA25_19780 [Dolichospermum sp. DET50]|nr:hypothetical protein [Dolichospermum sp. DET66]MBS3034435.1 hypothetical protein [Dolichospermum sp. DET67]MBS3039638.1 hypothetical protein [Dolichospermum sp. DET50]QSX66847.1 MAG: hypothetical protein EZY12_19050 [Dolichospermum sp. DET69]